MPLVFCVSGTLSSAYMGFMGYTFCGHNWKSACFFPQPRPHRCEHGHLPIQQEGIFGQILDAHYIILPEFLPQPDGHGVPGRDSGPTVLGELPKSLQHLWFAFI